MKIKIALGLLVLAAFVVLAYFVLLPAQQPMLEYFDRVEPAFH